MTTVAVLGTGMAALGAAHRFSHEGLQPTLYDKNLHPGGHTASFPQQNGFLFDNGPHISFTKIPRLQELFAASVDHQYETIQVRVNNYWQGHWIKHPAQCNLYGLPASLVTAIIRDFVDSEMAPRRDVRNYADWLVTTFGRTFAETFPFEYTERYHTTTPDNLTLDWLGPRFYRPTLEEMLRGALESTTPDVHYVTHFRYPSRGGFVSFLKLFIDRARIRLDHQVVALDPRARVVRFSNGTAVRYDGLVSSMPLPELVPLISAVPADVLEAVNRLAATTCVLINVGVDRSDISAAHWTYFYDRDFFFTRLSFPHMQSPNNVPPGAGSIQAEVYYSKKYRPLDRPPEACIEPVLRDLHRCGLLRERDRVLFTEARLIPYANVIFDPERKDALATVHGFLDECGIAYCGRYGEWGYHWTDESFVSGENAAQRILDGRP